MSQIKIARRELLRGTLTVTAALPLASLPIVLHADGHRVSEDDASAKALGYKHDATTVDTAKYPRRAGTDGANQFCDNCKLYSAGSENGWGACSIFPGKEVNAKGWCNAWIADG